MENRVNKVAESGIITLDLEQFFPQTRIVSFDLKPFLFMGLILKEKEFRQQLKELDLAPYKDVLVAVHCSADAIIPQWAYMLVASLLQPGASDVLFGNEQDVETILLLRAIEQTDARVYENQRVVVKGCGDRKIPDAAYLNITNKLRPVAKSIMFGEPCSTVPVYKQKTTT
ncbi:MAG: DUF2480 family protein [Ferruginibacter sp.]